MEALQDIIKTSDDLILFHVEHYVVKKSIDNLF